MFTSKPPPDFYDVSDVIGAEKHPAGQVFVYPQADILFGQNKKEPGFTRPVVSIKQDAGQRFLVTPLTGKDSPDNRYLGFELSKSRVMWSSKTPSLMWAIWTVEVVRKDRLLSVMGYLTPRGKADFKDWAQKRHAKRNA